MARNWLSLKARAASRPSLRPTLCGRRLQLESLEGRDVPCADIGDIGGAGIGDIGELNFKPQGLTDFPEPATAQRLVTQQEAFSLHSRPNAHQVIFLDFDGNTTSGTIWNDQIAGGADIVTPAYDRVGRYLLDPSGNPDPTRPNPAYDPNSFTSQELTNIYQIWERVAEDYSPFDVDVTTEDPGVERLRNTGGADNQWGVRAAIGGYSTDWFDPTPGALGVAYISSFSWDTDTPVFIFTESLWDPTKSDFTNSKWVGDDIAHEVGHSVGLLHDGLTSPPSGYFSGFGTGATGWGPIMGNPFDEPLTQWSKGEYTNANNQEDDLGIITTGNGFGFRDDDHGNLPSLATPMTFDTATTVSGSGVIERPTDVDYYSFHSGAGTIDIQINPEAIGANLDILAEIYDSTGDLVTYDNPVNALNARVQVTVPAGDYYLKIDGVGKGTQGTGYSDYGSLGQYSFTGTVPQDIPSNSLRVTGVSTTELSTGAVSKFRLKFNVDPDPTRLTPDTLVVTGPTGAILPVASVLPVTGSTTDFDVTLAKPIKFPAPPATGGIRIAVSPFVTDTSGRKLDQDGDLIFGETTDFFAAAAFQFNALTGGTIADNGVTDFPLTIPAGRPLNIKDLNVRVNLTHPHLGDLRIDLVSPTNKVIQLVSAGTLTRANLSNTRFDDQATKTQDQATGPYVGVFRAVGTLGLVNGDSAIGTWKLRVTDAIPGTTGKLNSWGMTLTTDNARTGLVLNNVTPINDAASNVATLVRGLTLDFASAVNPATLTRSDIMVTDAATGRNLRIFSVTPVTSTQFAVVTAPWTTAGGYVVRVGPYIADTFGNSLEANGNGFFGEAADIHWQTITVPDNVFLKSPNLGIGPGRAVSSSVVVRSPITINRLAVQFSLSDPNVGDLKISLVGPNGQTFVLVNQGTTAGANYDRTTFSDAAAGPITAGTSPYRGDFKPVDSFAPLVGTIAQGTWQLRIENIGASATAKLLSWSLFIR